MNPLKQLLNEKQSFWFDFINRDLMKSGRLKKLIQEDGLRGLTSNPSIFEKAISSGSDYDADIKMLAQKNISTDEIFENLAVKDIQSAADVFKPVFVESKGEDGYVSLEVNPDLANDTAGTAEQAQRLFKWVKRPNLMIKIPATPAGIPAIQQSLANGVNINITLIFSVEDYKKVLEAYLSALEQRVRKGLPVKNIASVASFFVSRVDTILDKQLDALVAKGGSQGEKAKALLHKAAIANAKLAYDHYLQVKASDRWQKLAKKGARVQRLLWGSTSAKDKRLPDTIYISELIGPETVNTIPPATVDAFRDHGVVEPKLTQGLDQAKRDIAALADVGIDLEKNLRVLQDEGVAQFSQAFESLLQVVGAKRELLTGAQSRKIQFSLGTAASAFETELKRVASENWVKRIWEKDATLWKSEDDHQKIIKNSLGWLRVPRHIKRNHTLLQTITADVRKAKFTHVLLLGMGGSSLCPEVLRLTFGKKGGAPDLAILDSTEPASVLERAARSKPERTLYIVASKSGSTSEPNAFLATFYDLVRKKKGDKAGENFIAITDPGTTMEKIAREKKFRHIVINPSDIGGRYSALSFFGMLPAAIMGINVEDLLDRTLEVADACSPLVPAEKNPGVRVGAALGVLANAGRNKVTFLLSKDIGSFATWVEQLIAESTGKEGKGILPVESEPVIDPKQYANDRVFVSLQTKKDAAIEKKVAAVRKAGHPVIQVNVGAKENIGQLIFLWEFATAVAGASMGIDPFDQPNVQESKDLTKKYLDQFRSSGKLSDAAPTVQSDGLKAFATNGGSSAHSIEELLASVFKSVRPGDYVALLAYLTRDPKIETVLQDIRATILKSKNVATTIGFGPRFLHSTGQLHKGGDNHGVFLQITADDKKDAPIPGEPFSYSILKEAQALGDLSALENKHRRAVRIHLSDTAKGLLKLRDIIKKVTSN